MTTLINLRKTKKYDELIDRRSIYGNPFRIGIDGTRDEVIEKYRIYFYKKLKSPIFREKVLELKNKILACWCIPQKCHGMIICDYLNNLDKIINL